MLASSLTGAAAAHVVGNISAPWVVHAVDMRRDNEGNIRRNVSAHQVPITSVAPGVCADSKEIQARLKVEFDLAEKECVFTQ